MELKVGTGSNPVSASMYVNYEPLYPHTRGFTCGIIPFIYKISERSIERMIRRYRKDFPEDKRSNEELRSSAVNEIMYRRIEKGKLKVRRGL